MSLSSSVALVITVSQKLFSPSVAHGIELLAVFFLYFACKAYCKSLRPIHLDISR